MVNGGIGVLGSVLAARAWLYDCQRCQHRESLPAPLSKTSSAGVLAAG